VAREAERRLIGRNGAAPGNGRPRRLPEEALVDELLADPVAWFELEKPVLVAASIQARAENRRVLASELSQVVARLERAVTG
jgi:hypothetical protein